MDFEAAGRRTIDIEKLLHWTYRDELPKRGAEWGGSAGYSPGFGGIAHEVDNWSREPGFPTLLGPPHPDAEIVDRAVQKLDMLLIMAAAGADYLCPDCLGLIEPDDITLAELPIDPTPYVVMHAKMGTRPDWRADWSVSRRVSARGATVIVGLNPNKTYQAGAHCPIDIWPPARTVATDRAIYVAWHMSLAALCESLSGLTRWIVMPAAAAAAPWLEGDRPVNILPDLRKTAVSKEAHRQRHRQRA